MVVTALLPAANATGRRLRSDGVAGSKQTARLLPDSGIPSDPNVRKPANHDACRLQDEASFQGKPAAGRSSRVRKQVQKYADTGSSTRKKQKPVDDCMDVDDIASIMASMSQPLQEQADGRTNADKNKAQARLVRQRTALHKTIRKEQASFNHQMLLAKVKELCDGLMADRSWRQRKEDAFLAYAAEISAGKSKGDAYEMAAKMARVSERTVRTWCPAFIENDGLFPTSTWGCNCKVPSVFLDTEIQLKSAKWWRQHGPKAGEPAPRIADFRTFLCGHTDDSETGLLYDVLQTGCRSGISEEQCRQFTHQLGFDYVSLQKGSFNDNHESEDNQQDRQHRFLPEYFKFYAASPHLFKGEDSDLFLDVKVRQNIVAIIGRDGKSREFDLGGGVPEGMPQLCDCKGIVISMLHR